MAEEHLGGPPVSTVSGKIVMTTELTLHFNQTVIKMNNNDYTVGGVTIDEDLVVGNDFRGNMLMIRPEAEIIEQESGTTDVCIRWRDSFFLAQHDTFIPASSLDHIEMKVKITFAPKS